MLAFLMHCQMRNSSESRNFNSKVLAKAKQKQNSNNKTIGWPFEGQAVRTGGEGLEQFVGWGLAASCPSCVHLAISVVLGRQQRRIWSNTFYIHISSVHMDVVLPDERGED